MLPHVQQPGLFDAVEKAAFLSRNRLYRYELWRRWGDGDRYVNFICLNPSTADETADDPTTNKCVKYAKAWGYGALCITNLFAYRSTSPEAMKKFADPVGFGNNRHLLDIAKGASLIVCAWGLHGSHLGRAARVKNLLHRFDLYYLRITREQPWHPLYLPDNIRPSRWPRDLR